MWNRPRSANRVFDVINGTIAFPVSQIPHLPQNRTFWAIYSTIDCTRSGEHSNRWRNEREWTGFCNRVYSVSRNNVPMKKLWFGDCTSPIWNTFISTYSNRLSCDAIYRGNSKKTKSDKHKPWCALCSPTATCLSAQSGCHMSVKKVWRSRKSSNKIVNDRML